MSERDGATPAEWDERYASGDTPWDTGEPSRFLVRVVGGVAPCCALEVGCGTGANAAFLASRGFETYGVDLSARAVSEAVRRARSDGVRARFAVADVLALPFATRFGLVFDRGVFHAFGPEDRPRYAASVAGVLSAGGTYAMLCFSTEETSEGGPPHRISPEMVEETFSRGFEVLSVERFAMKTRDPSFSPRALGVVLRRRSA